MEKRDDSRLRYALYIIGTYLIIFILWTIKTFTLEGWISGLGEWGQALVNSFFKCIILIPIPLWLIKRKKVSVSLKEMFTNKVSFEVLGPILAAFLAKGILEMFNKFGGFGISENLHISNLIGSFLLVGITEELLFRGWIYNALLTCVSKTSAIIIQALLFVTLHFPAYMYGGSLFSPTAIANYFLLFVLSIAFAWAFKKNKSIWTPIILHMVWDLMMLLVL